MTPSQADPSSRAEFKDRVLGGGRTCGGVVSYQRVFSALRSVVSSVDRISYHKGGKQKHSSPCLIHWAATVSVQRGGKDNFPRGRLPGAALDHRLPSSAFSAFVNQNVVKVYQSKRFYLLQLRMELCLQRDDGLFLCT